LNNEKERHMANASDEIRHIFVVGLRNAHAVEHQALSLMDRQIEHLAHYAEVEQRLRTHRGETEQQIERLEQILDSLGESPSTLKDTAMTISGNLAALGHTFAPDEIIKNSLANYAFENFEAATYKSLITIAEEGGFTSAIPLLQQTLQEELAMVVFLDEMQPMVIRKFLERRSAGAEASH
jgi:ferritin-like metal-binding protein YciE